MYSKECIKCKELLPIDQFSVNKSRKDGLQSSCKKCLSARNRDYYLKNKQKIYENISNNKSKRTQENRIKLLEYLKENPCVKCGYSNPIALEFDHIKDKVMDVSRMVSGGYSWNRIFEEINKCDVLCANCHKIKTAEQQRWWKSIL